jgi:hypothetical protein
MFSLLRVVVALSGKVDPLGMSELVAAKVEDGVASQDPREGEDELVQRNGAVQSNGRRRQHRHVRVHQRVGQPHDQRLVANKRLIVTLTIPMFFKRVSHKATFFLRDVFFSCSSVCGDVEELRDVPLLVGLVLEEGDPHVGDGHVEAVVEAEAALAHGSGEAGIARDVLGQRDAAELVRDRVGEQQVRDGVLVRVGAKVLGIAPREVAADAVVRVEHAGDAVEAKAVHAILPRPKGNVGQQKAKHLPLAVVEQTRVPLGMTTASTLP